MAHSSSHGDGGVNVVLDKLDDSANPHCRHGPTLLFERFTGNKVKQFYACSACRDRKHCSFFQWADQAPAKDTFHRKQTEVKQEQKTQFTKQQYKIRLNTIRCLPKKKRSMCQTCGQLLLPEEVEAHSKHALLSNLTKLQLRRPTHLLVPLDNNKSNAQYLFSEKTTTFLIDTIENLGFKKVLCLGVPRIHEEICSRQKKKTTTLRSLLLDIDQRLEQFFPGKQFCRYNMFNHYFFTGSKGREVYNNFLSMEEAEPLLVLMDPPFGGLVNVLSHTLKKLKDDWRSLNPADDTDVCEDKDLSCLWIFPYFMEPRVLGSLPNFSMLDYKVDYDNHTAFKGDQKGRKYGSPVRIFTNLAPAVVQLPEEEYKFCERCKRYVSTENKHCDICNACTSKDGRRYVHCEPCSRCVKPSWAHCDRCSRCHLPNTDCYMPNTGCQVCGDNSHKRNQCPNKPALKRKKKDTSHFRKRKKTAM